MHNEASDSSRINHLSFKVLEVRINSDQLTPWDMKTHLELEDFKLAEDADQELVLELGFGTLETKKSPVTILADQNGLLKSVPTFRYDEIQCQLNRDLADYFKMFYSGAVRVNLSLKNGATFASCHVNIKQSLR